MLDEALAMNANAAVFAFQFQNLSNEEAACALAFDRPNLSVYAADGAVINGVAGKWRLGDPPKNWSEIRASFWGRRGDDDESVFLLGDFSSFSRFSALSHSTDMIRPSTPEVEDSVAGTAEK